MSKEIKTYIRDAFKKQDRKEQNMISTHTGRPGKLSWGCNCYICQEAQNEYLQPVGTTP